MIEVSDLIDGDFFESIADFRFDGTYRSIDNITAGKTHIVYSPTDMCVPLFRLLDKEDFKIILLTHNSDVCVTDQHRELLNQNKSIVKWYSQNVNTIDERIIPIPIGLERKRWFLEQRKQDTLLEYRNLNINIENLLYLNHNQNTNSTKRSYLYNHFEKYDWVSIFKGQNGMNYRNFLTDIKKHQYMLSPDGNGIDCHRTWEILYLDRFPILERCHNHEVIYKDLPVLLVDSFKDITEELLVENIPILLSKRKEAHLKNSFYKNIII